MKIQIRKQKLSDAEDFRKFLNDKDLLKQLSGIPSPYTLKKAREDIKKSQNEWKSGKAYSFTVLVNGQVAGNTLLHQPNEDKKRYDLGFWIGKEFWGKGIATEAVKKTLKYGFNKLKLYRIQADNYSDNPASGKVMKKAGMEFEGTREKYQKKGNKFVDLHLWGITK